MSPPTPNVTTKAKPTSGSVTKTTTSGTKTTPSTKTTPGNKTTPHGSGTGIAAELVKSNYDSRGILRGRCNFIQGSNGFLCSCDEFTSTVAMLDTCSYCGCRSTLHDNLSTYLKPFDQTLDLTQNFSSYINQQPDVSPTTKTPWSGIIQAGAKGSGRDLSPITTPTPTPSKTPDSG